MENVFLSVIVPVYNVAPYIERCLNSILSQSLREIEIICVEDCSTDDSQHVLLSLAKIDERIRMFINPENRGLGYSRNRGLSEAVGEYVWFIDSDDYVEDRDTARTLCEYASNHHLDILMFDAICSFEDDSLKDRFQEEVPRRSCQYDEILTGREMFCRQMANGDFYSLSPLHLYRRAFLQSHGLLFENIVHEDFLFAFDTAMSAERVTFINRAFYNYYRRNRSITTDGDLLKSLHGHLYTCESLISRLKNVDGTEQFADMACVFFSMIVRNAKKAYAATMIAGISVKTLPVADKVILREIMKNHFPYIQSLMDENIYQRITQRNRIVVYGAGNVAGDVLRLLQLLELPYTVAVTNGKREGIYELHELKETAANSVVLLATTTEKHSEMIKYAESLGFDLFVPMCSR